MGFLADALQANALSSRAAVSLPMVNLAQPTGTSSGFEASTVAAHTVEPTSDVYMAAQAPLADHHVKMEQFVQDLHVEIDDLAIQPGQNDGSKVLRAEGQLPLSNGTWVPHCCVC